MATELPSSENPNDAALKAAMKGFDHLFSNDIVGARKEFAADHTPFHWMGLGACAFLQAALGMEVSNIVTWYTSRLQHFYCILGISHGRGYPLLNQSRGRIQDLAEIGEEFIFLKISTGN